MISTLILTVIGALAGIRNKGITEVPGSYRTMITGGSHTAPLFRLSEVSAVRELWLIRQRGAIVSKRTITSAVD
jgi:starvation-inducible outer membrane lipoprotein